MTTKNKLYTYTVKTDAVSQEIEATSIDEAAKIFAEDEFPGCTTVEELFAAIDEIDGAWCWIEGDRHAPDGRRRSINTEGI